MTKNTPIFIAGPCVIESQELLNVIAEELKAINNDLGIDMGVFFVMTLPFYNQMAIFFLVFIIAKLAKNA